MAAGEAAAWLSGGDNVEPRMTHVHSHAVRGTHAPPPSTPLWHGIGLESVGYGEGLGRFKAEDRIMTANNLRAKLDAVIGDHGVVGGTHQLRDHFPYGRSH